MLDHTMLDIIIFWTPKLGLTDLIDQFERQENSNFKKSKQLMSESVLGVQRIVVLLKLYLI